MKQILALVWDSDRQQLAYKAMPDNAYTKLHTAICISLFTDAAALPDDLLDGEANRGYWGDIALPTGESLGSQLWLLQRRKLTADVLLKASDYATAAVAWMVEVGIVQAVQVEAQRYNLDTLMFTVTYQLPSDTNWQKLLLEWKNGL